MTIQGEDGTVYTLVRRTSDGVHGFVDHAREELLFEDDELTHYQRCIMVVARAAFHRREHPPVEELDI